MPEPLDPWDFAGPEIRSRRTTATNHREFLARMRQEAADREARGRVSAALQRRGLPECPLCDRAYFGPACPDCSAL